MALAWAGQRPRGEAMKGVRHDAGLEKVQAAAGNIARFQLIFKLTSDVNDNYLHIHTMKGILVASRVTFPCISLVPCKAGAPHSLTLARAMSRMRTHAIQSAV